MKHKLLKIVTISTIFAFGVGLSVNNFATPTKVEATQYLDDYALYTYSGSYYDSIDFNSTDGMNGNLRQSISTLIKPKDFYIYGSQGTDHLATQLQYADEDPTNSANMVYLYTRDSVTKNSASSWNREHVWPKASSNGNWGTEEGGTDILHIRPTYETTNNKRGNTPYGDTNKTGALTYNNMLYGYLNGNYFEPLDEVKGDVARIIMYVWTAYNNYPGYKNLNILSVFQSYDLLLKWHMNDKPDALEGNRNNYAEKSVQKNRNPFVDHPELAWRIFGDSATTLVKNQCKETYPSSGYNPDQKQLERIELSGEATYKEYYVGQTFNPDGLTVTAYYSDGSTKEIPTNNCSWLPDPLIEGMLTVTCKYGDCTAIYKGITVTKRVTAGGVYSVEFTQTADSGTDITPSTISSYMKNNTLIDSATNIYKVFPGASGLKFGSSSANGEITFNIIGDAQSNIVKISVETDSYKGSGGYTVKLNNNVIGDGLDAGTLFEKDLQKINASTISISSVGRMYLKSISLEIEENQPEPPIGGDDSSSSSMSLNPGDPYTTSHPGNISFSGMSNGGYQSDVPSSTFDSQSPSENDNKKGLFGCSGSVLSITIATFATALIGIVFIASKKK